jgi:hypothetical protein
MGFETPQPALSEYLAWTTSGVLQLPDFQREYKWDEERIRALLVTVLRGHPMGAVMLLETGNDQVRFKPKPITGTAPPASTMPTYLLLDGQQRLTSLTQTLTGRGVVHTKDSRDKLISRRYFVDMRIAVEGDERIDDAVFSVPEDGVERENFGRDVVRDLSTSSLQQAAAAFPLSLLFADYDRMDWLFGIEDRELVRAFTDQVLKPVANYQIPAIQLKKDTNKAAVATVFEKVNTGGVPLNVFELLTATFAGDADYFDAHGEDFRLNDDWKSIHTELTAERALRGIKSTDFLQAITLLTTRKRNLASTAERPPAISAKRDDILRLQLTDYLEWRDALLKGFKWAALFLADHHIFDETFLPYSTQLVPLAAIRVVLGADADNHSVRSKLNRWYWSGILGELYGSTTETRFARDVEHVPAWARGDDGALEPRTVSDAIFAESRLYSLSSRRSAAYKGIYALQVKSGAKDWIRDVAFDKVQYSSLATDIHHIFPYDWCKKNGVEPARRDSIVNKTPLAAETNRSIGGAAPSKYLVRVASNSGLEPAEVDAVVATHGIDTEALRADDFDRHFAYRKNVVLGLIEDALGKPVQRETTDIDPTAIAAEYEQAEDDEAEQVQIDA